MTAKETDYEGGTTMFQECQGTSHQRSEVLSTRYVMDGGNGFHRCPDGARRGGDGGKWLLRTAKAGGKKKAPTLVTHYIIASINAPTDLTCSVFFKTAFSEFIIQSSIRNYLLRAANIGI